MCLFLVVFYCDDYLYVRKVLVKVVVAMVMVVVMSIIITMLTMMMIITIISVIIISSSSSSCCRIVIMALNSAILGFQRAAFGTMRSYFRAWLNGDDSELDYKLYFRSAVMGVFMS